MKDGIIKFLATGTYLGLSPVIPGTFGTLWGIPIVWAYSKSPLSVQIIIIIAVSIAAIFISDEACRIFGKKDPSSVVIDEVAGYLVSFFLIPFTAFNAILIFLLFRFFDILKPYPVCAIDRGVGGGLGVVLDDLAAGVYANICAQIIIRLL